MKAPTKAQLRAEIDELHGILSATEQAGADIVAALDEAMELLERWAAFAARQREKGAAIPQPLFDETKAALAKQAASTSASISEGEVEGWQQALCDRGVTCSYPACNCPVDGPDTCARGLDRQAAQQKEGM